MLFVSVVLYINHVKNRNGQACHKYFIGHLFFAHLLQVSTLFFLDVMLGWATPEVYYRPQRLWLLHELHIRNGRVIRVSLVLKTDY